MATPTTLPASFVSGAVLTAAQQNSLRGAFRILQVVESANDTTLRSSTSTSYTDSGLSLTITPQSTSNKILLAYNICYFASAASTGLAIRSIRGATVCVIDEDMGYGTNSGVAGNTALVYIDSPATISAVTYKIQLARNQGSGIAYMNAAANRTSRFYAMEISA